MKTLIITLILATCLFAGQLVSKDSTGIIIELKEKYGSLKTDTCNIIMIYGKFFVLTQKDGNTSWYNCTNYSIKIKEKLSE